MTTPTPKLTRQEGLRAAAALHREWSLRHGDTVPFNPDDAAPHDGQQSDLGLWQADRSAPPEVDDELNAQLVAILDQMER